MIKKVEINILATINYKLSQIIKYNNNNNNKINLWKKNFQKLLFSLKKNKNKFKLEINNKL